MFKSRREVIALAGTAVATRPPKPARADMVNLAEVPASFHERAMRAAIRNGQSGFYPFGAVIVRPPSEELLAGGVNTGRVNPTWHGEIVCMNDYIARHGNQGWDGCILYTTGEPCPMCMGALIWAGIGGVVYGTSIATLGQKLGLRQISIPASEVIAAASGFRHVALLGGVLAGETDALFAERLKRPTSGRSSD